METINQETGEVVVASKFRTIYGGVNPTWQDCSNKYQKRFKEIPPYAIDVNTGKFCTTSGLAISISANLTSFEL